MDAELEDRLKLCEEKLERLEQMTFIGKVLWRIMLYTGAALVGITEIWDRVQHSWGWWAK